MGYCMYQQDSRFRIKAEHHARAARAVKRLCRGRLDRLGRGRTKLPELLAEWGWQVVLDPKKGDITTIEFTGEKSCEDLRLFQALARYVKKGSFIAMRGEDGCLWRWWFDGRQVTEQFGKVEYQP